MAFPIFIFAWFTAIAGISSWIHFWDKTDLSLPGNYSVPYLLIVVGAGYYMFAVNGVRGVMSALATAVFVGATVLFINQRFRDQ